MPAPAGPKPAICSHSYRAKISQIRVVWSCQAQEALLFNQNPNVQLIVVQSSYCCSVVSVNTSNTVQPLTLGCSSLYNIPQSICRALHLEALQNCETPAVEPLSNHCRTAVEPAVARAQHEAFSAQETCCEHFRERDVIHSKLLSGP